LTLPDSVFRTIQQGQIAVIDNYLSVSEVTQLRYDAQTLYKEHHFQTDAIAGYSGSKQRQDKAQFDVTKDRSVCPAYFPSQQTTGPFVNDQLGNAPRLRIHKFMKHRIASLRRDLAIGLDRPGMQKLQDGINNHEISYTRYGPGAYLKRHTDEHHEELKGVAGWKNPTRRSLSWLIYLNEQDWSSTSDGGILRTYPRLATTAAAATADMAKAATATTITTIGGGGGGVGSCHGDLQIGWLVPTLRDPVERPVFLDGQRHGQSGNCALYVDAVHDNSNNNDNNKNKKNYLTRDFWADPYLFLSTDWVVQHLLITKQELGSRFHYIEPPKSLLTEYWDKIQRMSNNEYHIHMGETIRDVAPTGGTLVMFDSVVLPHEVLATVGRERWAVSGWFHEAQQDIPQKQKHLRL